MLARALFDLATAADTQAARAAELDNIEISAPLFDLADKIRVLARKAAAAERQKVTGLLDSGRVQIASALLRLEHAEGQI